MRSFKVGIITLSDKGFRGERVDESGPLIKKILPENFTVLAEELLPDEQKMLEEQLIKLCATCDLILTTGGTGLSSRDVTPEATLAVADKEVPGISEGMRMMSLEKTPFGMLSRGVAVLRGQTLIINLPGSPKAVEENLNYLLPVLPHALEIVTDLNTEH